MKRILVVLFLLYSWFSQYQCYGQEPQKVDTTKRASKAKGKKGSLPIVFDCGNSPCKVVSPDPLPKYVREGSLISIEYINVNPHAIKSNVSGVFFNANYSDGSDALQNILTTLGKAQNEQTAQADSVNKKTSNLSEAQRVVSASPTFSPTMLKERGLYDFFQKAKLPVHVSTAKQKASALTRIQKGIDSSAILREWLEKKQKAIDAINANRRNLAKAIDSISSVINLGNTIEIVSSDPNVSSAKELAKIIQDAAGFSFKDAGDINTTFKVSLGSARNFIAQMAGNLETLSDINTEIKKIDPNISSDKLIDSLTSAMKKLDDVYYGKQNSDSMRIAVQNIIINYQKVTKEFSLGNTTFSMSDDELDISDSLMTSKNALFRKIGPIKFYSYGGTRLDLALGLAITTGNLNPNSYYIIRDSLGKAKGIGSSRKNSIGDFSPILFFHYTIKCPSPLSFAISLGLNPDFSTVGNSKVLVGVSVAFTQSNNILKRLVLSGGIGGGLTDEIQPKYYDTSFVNSSNYAQILSTLSDKDLTEKTFRIGGFFGVSFNVADLKKK